MHRCAAVVACVAILASPHQPAAAQSKRFIPGQRTVYSIVYSNATRSDLTSLFGMDSTSGSQSPLVHNIESELRGELVQTVMRRDSSIVRVAYRLRDVNVRLRVNGQDAPSSAKTIEENLLKTITAILTPDGRIVSVRFDPSMDELSRSFARTLLASAQFVVPETSGDSAWETQEDDPAGTYVARYRRAPDGRTYERTKARYLTQATVRRKGDVGVTQTVEPGGYTTGVFDRKSRGPLSLDGLERQRVRVAGEVIASGITDFRMRYVGTGKVDSREFAAMIDSARVRERLGAAERLSTNESEDASEATVHRAALRDGTAASLLAQLEAREAAASDSGSATELYLKFKALVYLHPEASTELGNVLGGTAANSRTMFILSEALGSVGHASAQKALINVIHSRMNDWQALATLIPVLGGVREPTDEAVRLMLQLAFDSGDPAIGSTARLASGTMARSLAVRFPARAAPIVERLLAAMDSSTSSSSKRELLLALGNSGSVLALPAIERFSVDRDELLRAASVLALRWVDGSRAESLLVKALSKDSDAGVRLAAVRALGDREMNAATFKAQKTAFSIDESADVRAAVLENLWRARDKHPEVREIVKTASNDQAKPVRDAASRMR